MFLTVHPDLQVWQTSWEGKTITLLGYILDPDSPESNDLDIISRVVRQVQRADDILGLTDNLGGRWIIILNDGKALRLIHDATGCRQVFYTNDHSLGMWCASQPGIIAEELNLEMDEDALNNFIDSPACKSRLEYCWPGDSSPYKEIKHLSPNYCLDLKKATCHRYWPDRKFTNLSLEKAVRTSSNLLRGLIKAASNRFDLALALTAGWDSRALLAASKEVSESIFYYTLMYWDLTDESPDVKIPSEVLSQLGLKHNLIKCPSHMDNKFKEIYKRNVTTAHDAWGNIAQGIYEHYPQDRVCMKANIGEIARCYYRLAFFEKISAHTLARLTDMDKNPFAIKYMAKWLSEAKEIAERHGINILDLFYWEQRMGNWYAMSQLEWDIAQEVFSPFNCRTLLATMLSVEERYRKPRHYKLFEKLIVNLWPELLTKPINPTPPGLRPAIKKLLVQANLYHVTQRYILTPVQRYMYSRK